MASLIGINNVMMYQGYNPGYTTTGTSTMMGMDPVAKPQPSQMVVIDDLKKIYGYPLKPNTTLIIPDSLWIESDPVVAQEARTALIKGITDKMLEAQTGPGQTLMISLNRAVYGTSTTTVDMGMLTADMPQLAIREESEGATQFKPLFALITQIKKTSAELMKVKESNADQLGL